MVLSFLLLLELQNAKTEKKQSTRKSEAMGQEGGSNKKATCAKFSQTELSKFRAFYNGDFDRFFEISV